MALVPGCGEAAPGCGSSLLRTALRAVIPVLWVDTANSYISATRGHRLRRGRPVFKAILQNNSLSDEQGTLMLLTGNATDFGRNPDVPLTEQLSFIFGNSREGAIE